MSRVVTTIVPASIVDRDTIRPRISVETHKCNIIVVYRLNLPVIPQSTSPRRPSEPYLNIDVVFENIV